MKLLLVIPYIDKEDYTVACAKRFIQTQQTKDVFYLFVNNGSDDINAINSRLVGEGLLDWNNSATLRFNENIGLYPLINHIRDYVGSLPEKPEVVIFTHNDLYMYEQGWDDRLLQEFTKDPELALVGVIGSREVDDLGGRGLGTASNFQGKVGGNWAVHGALVSGLMPSAIIDGCFMAFRWADLDRLEIKQGFPPHHFYDKMISCQMLENNKHLGTLGLVCDHESGQTANTSDKWVQTAKKWVEENLGITEPNQWYENNKEWADTGRRQAWEHTGKVNGFDHAIYLESEMRFLKEYRDQKGIVPQTSGKRLKVYPDFTKHYIP